MAVGRVKKEKFRCAKCGASNGAGQRFCSRCGALAPGAEPPRLPNGQGKTAQTNAGKGFWRNLVGLLGSGAKAPQGRPNQVWTPSNRAPQGRPNQVWTPSNRAPQGRPNQVWTPSNRAPQGRPNQVWTPSNRAPQARPNPIWRPQGAPSQAAWREEAQTKHDRKYWPEAQDLATYGAKSFTACFQKYFQFRGRATRSEFWSWLMWNAIFIAIVLFGYLWLINMAFAQSARIDLENVLGGGASKMGTVWGLRAFGILLGAIGLFGILASVSPTCAVATRRLHDSNLSSKYLLGLLPSGAYCVWTPLMWWLGEFWPELLSGWNLGKTAEFARSFPGIGVLLFCAIVFGALTLRRSTLGPNRFGLQPID